MSAVPRPGVHLTYQLQYRTCGKASCRACRSGFRHGPYWYAYWREQRRLRSAYIGKGAPPPCRCERCMAHDESSIEGPRAQRASPPALSLATPGLM
jgi:hypothetical protein